MNNSYIKKPSNQKTDERLFLRLHKNDVLRQLSGYALQTHIKTKLGFEGHLLSNVLPTKTRFALCPSARNSETLVEKLASNNILNGKLLEKATPWTSYRISNVPRKYDTTNVFFQLIMVDVTTEAIIEALTAAVGVPPISVSPHEITIHPRTQQLHPE